MFGNKAKGLTIVYKFGCKPPETENLRLALDELYLRNRLWNQLVEIERCFRGQRDPLLVSAMDHEIESIKDQISDLSQLLKNTKAAAAYNTVALGQEISRIKDLLRRIQKLIDEHVLEPAAPKKKYQSIPILLFDSLQTRCSVEELKQSIGFLRETLKPLYAFAKTERKKLFERNQDRIKELEQERALAVKTARQQSGLYWGNYNDVIASYETARSASLKTWSQLRFQSYDGSGNLTVQFIQPLRADQMYGSNGQLQVDPIPDSAWDKTRGRARKKDQWAMARLRVKSTDKKKPIWLELPVCIHRPLPANAMIQLASVNRVKVGLEWRYSLLVTIRIPEPAVRKSKLPTAVIRFCSRLTDDRSLHVATVERRGKHSDLEIPVRTANQFEQVDNLRAITDQYQSAAQTAIRELRTSDTIPVWFKDDTQYTHIWRKSKAYLQLWHRWSSQRFQDDAKAFAALEAFRERYYHLYPWEANLRDQLLHNRKNLYRNFAAMLVKTCGSIVLEPLAETKPKQAETETQERTNKRYWLRVAALSHLQTIIKNTARREGVPVEMLKHVDLQAVA